MVLFPHSSFRAAPPDGKTKQPDPTVCPNGHPDLKKIPIIYGLLSHLRKPEKDRTPEERELAGQIKRREVIWGGCCIDNEDPDHRLRCLKCGFEFHRYSGRMDINFWTRNGAKPEHPESFSSYAQKLVGGSALQPLSWVTHQDLLNGRLAHEQIEFEILPAQFDSLRNTLSKWTHDMLLPDSYVPVSLNGLKAAPFHQGSIRPDQHYVRIVITVTEAQHIHVALIVCHEDNAAKWLQTQTAIPGIPASLR